MIILLQASPYTNEALQFLASALPYIGTAVAGGATFYLQFIEKTQKTKLEQAEARADELALKQVEFARIKSEHRQYCLALNAVVTQCETALEVVQTFNVDMPETMQTQISVLQNTVMINFQTANSTLEDGVFRDRYEQRRQ